MERSRKLAAVRQQDLWSTFVSLHCCAAPLWDADALQEAIRARGRRPEDVTYDLLAELYEQEQNGVPAVACEPRHLATASE